MNTKKKFLIVLLTIAFAISLAGCDGQEADEAKSIDAPVTAAEIEENPEIVEILQEESYENFEELPEFDGEPYVEINGNEPEFDDNIMAEESFESYGELDDHGRCTTAIASLSTETQPAKNEERGDISPIHPTGWMSNQGWERCHLIGWQLCAENANRNNLVTGTHYMNVSGMLPFENMVDWYIEDTGNHVLYQVTPIFDGKNNICSGVHMQAESIEDDGDGVSFNIYCFNVSPGKEIDYRTGSVEVADYEVASANQGSRLYILNTNSMKFHYPSCKSVSDMSEYNKQKKTAKRSEIISMGYSPCGNCQP